jgi:threonylcarbamoyladenosine tRNA methylthiotransferase MtaB
MNVHLAMLGCRLNEAELETYARRFRDAGHAVVSTPQGAELMVVNTCAVTGEAARKSRKLIGGLHRQNPSAKLVVTGCYSELEPDKAAAQAGVDLVVPNRDKDRLVTIVSEQLDTHAMPRAAAEPEGSHVYQHSGRTRAFVKVQDGCRNRCTFCIVTVARGEERSRPVAELIEEIEALHRAGYREAVLTGVHLGGYGSDLDIDLYGLVRELLANTHIPRLRLSSLEPWDLPAHFWDLWDDPRLMPHLHLPLQSGHDAVLKRMARRCSTGTYRELVAGARAAIDGLNLTTDIIVGFPGETEDEHRASLELVESIGFGHIHIFSYSARQGTKAARLSGQLNGRVKKERSRQMHQLAARMKRERLARELGTTRPVLWEGTGAEAGDGRVWSGYTDNYLRVRVRVEGDVELENQITPARLTAISDCGQELIAELIP